MSRPLLAAILVALASRLIVACFCYTGITNPDRNHWPFGYETGRIAASIATGHGFGNPFFAQTGPTALMPPVYEYLLAAVFRMFGVYTSGSALAILGLQGLFAALTCIPIFLIARRWFGERTARWSAWIWALFPFGVYLAGDVVWDYCLTALLLTTLVWLAIDLDRQSSLWAWAGYGLLWGVTLLVNPSVLTVLPLAAGWALWRRRRDGFNWFAPAAVMLSVVLATVAPWEIRNDRTFHEWVPLRDGFWLEVWVDNNGDTTFRWDDAAHPSGSAVELQQFNTMGEVGYMALKRKEAIDFIQAHPSEFVWMSLRRFFFTWTGYWSFQPAYVAEYPFDSYNILLIAPLTLLMLLGLLQAYRRRLEGTGMLAAVLAVYPAVYYFTHASLKYRHPVDPEIVMLATFAVVSYLEVSRRKDPAGKGHEIGPRQPFETPSAV